MNTPDTSTDAVAGHVRDLAGLRVAVFHYLHPEYVASIDTATVTLEALAKERDELRAKLEAITDEVVLLPGQSTLDAVKQINCLLATDTAALTAAQAREARLWELLTSANKWVRMVDERRADVPQWLRHDADPRPLVAEIRAALANTEATP